MIRYVIRFMDEAIAHLVSLPSHLELQARRQLAEIARAACQVPPPGDPQWNPWNGVDLWALDFEVGGIRVVYALDVFDRAVVVRRIERTERPLWAPTPVLEPSPRVRPLQRNPSTWMN